jgi:uridine kinase
VICVTGVDTAGKTCFARALEEHLERLDDDVQVVHLDDFHHPRATRYARHGDEAHRYLHQSFDFGALIERVLVPLRRDGRLDVELELLDVLTDTLEQPRRYVVGADSVVIVEGVFLLRPELRRFWDLTIVLEVDWEVVCRRAYARDVPVFGDDVMRKYREKYLPAQQRYAAAVEPAKLADILIDNSDWRTPRIIRSADG